MMMLVVHALNSDCRSQKQLQAEPLGGRLPSVGLQEPKIFSIDPEKYQSLLEPQDLLVTELENALLVLTQGQLTDLNPSDLGFRQPFQRGSLRRSSSLPELLKSLLLLCRHRGWQPCIALTLLLGCGLLKPFGRKRGLPFLENPQLLQRISQRLTCYG
jgi:hypothetical protein